MKSKIFLAIGLLVLSFSAAADFKTVSRAYEVVLRDFRAPTTPNSVAFIKTCSSCDTMQLRVTPDTRYVVNGQPVTLKEFRDSVSQVNRRRAVPVIVLHHLESDTVVSISLTN